MLTSKEINRYKGYVVVFIPIEEFAEKKLKHREAHPDLINAGYDNVVDKGFLYVVDTCKKDICGFLWKNKE